MNITEEVLWNMCIHEAGHAVASVYYGATLWCVTVAGTKLDQGKIFSSFGNQGSQEKCNISGKVAIAGHLAEKHFFQKGECSKPNPDWLSVDKEILCESVISIDGNKNHINSYVFRSA